MKMEPMTRQQMFDKVYAGLAAQGFMKASGREGCMYRAPTGRRCGIGHLIPDFAYDHNLEGRLVGNIMKTLGFSDGDKAFLEYIQNAHDAAVTPSDMRERMRFVAREFHLEAPVDNEELGDEPFPGKSTYYVADKLGDKKIKVYDLWFDESPETPPAPALTATEMLAQRVLEEHSKSLTSAAIFYADDALVPKKWWTDVKVDHVRPYEPFYRSLEDA